MTGSRYQAVTTPIQKKKERFGDGEVQAMYGKSDT